MKMSHKDLIDYLITKGKTCSSYKLHDGVLHIYCYLEIEIYGFSELPDNVYFHYSVDFLKCHITSIPRGVTFEETCNLDYSTITHIDSTVIFNQVNMCGTGVLPLPSLYTNCILLNYVCSIRGCLYIKDTLFSFNSGYYRCMHRLQIDGYLIHTGLIT